MSATHGDALGKDGDWPALGVDDVGEAQDPFFFSRLTELALGGSTARAIVANESHPPGAAARTLGS